jgi:hypothetical protein
MQYTPDCKRHSLCGFSLRRSHFYVEGFPQRGARLSFKEPPSATAKGGIRCQHKTGSYALQDRVI